MHKDHNANMTIDFQPDRWQHIKATYRGWWAGQLDRPIVPVLLAGRDPGRACPAAPLLSQATCTDLAIPADDLIDRIDYELARVHYLGDAFPFFNMDCFGPGVVGAFMGARLDNSTGRVWFHPPAEQPIDRIHFRYDGDNPWFRRVKEIYAAGMRRWQGQVLMGMTDLGGNLDILSTFRPSETLLLDLYDHPAEVQRLTWEAHEAWHQYFAEINALLKPYTPGYSDWSGIYRETPGYMLQCDFAYMLSPRMFTKFVRPELAATCGRLDHCFYHLDGVGQLNHLALLLEIAALAGVQWIPGDGKPNCAHWPEVYRKIAAAGKRIQVLGDFDVLDAVIAQTGAASAIHLHPGWSPLGWDESAVRARLAQYGIE